MSSSHSCDRNLHRLAAVGLLGKAFPPSHVLLGLKVCKWMHKELAEQIESIALKVRDCGVVSGKQVAKGLCRCFCRAQVSFFGSTEARISKMVLEGLCQAVEADFGSGLVHLDLADSGFGGEVARTLVEVLGKCTNLTHLNVNGNGLMAETFSPPEEQITGGIRLCKHLRHLDMGGNAIFDDATALRSVLEDCPEIVHLDISSAEVGTEGMRALTEGSSTSLTHLALSDSEMCDEGAKLLAGAIGTKWGALRHLDIGGRKRIHEESASMLAQSLRNCSALTYLDLEDMSCQSAAKELGASLGAMQQLSHLSLARAQLSDVSASQLAAGLELRRCSSLSYLDLDSNDIGPKGIQALAAGLSSCKGLRTLFLGSNNVQSEGLVFLTEAMDRWGGLVELDLSRNGIRDVFVRELVEVSRQCSALKVLDISGNHAMSEQMIGWLNNLRYGPLMVLPE